LTGSSPLAPYSNIKDSKRKSSRAHRVVHGYAFRLSEQAAKSPRWVRLPEGNQ
jgi:hypothetical protein